MNCRNGNSRYFTETLYRDNYRKNFSFTNVDEIFNIADMHDDINSNDSTYEVYQVNRKIKKQF